ncbi:TPA: helix-turn-helix domain-containing protein [Yersinia enterocolitica]
MVPKRLREAREAAGMSQEKLSQLIDIDGKNSRSRLSSYEVGRTEPPFSLVVKIARLLDYPEYYFYTVDDDMAKNMLEVHRNRVNPEENLQYYTLEENKKLRKQNEEARKLLKQLNECLKD